VLGRIVNDSAGMEHASDVSMVLEQPERRVRVLRPDAKCAKSEVASENNEDCHKEPIPSHENPPAKMAA
jgi:hypothetical protein